MRLYLAGLILLLSSTAFAADRDIAVIAHRGASGHAPENTLAAFRKAVEAGSDFFEVDCRLTKDGHVIICHDTDIERTGGGEKIAVSDLSLAELQAKDAGSWFSSAFKGEKMPTLLESLAVATPTCGVYVEIKSERGDSAASRVLVQHAAGKKRLTKALRSELLAIANAADTQSLALTRACIADIRAKGMQKQVVIQSFSPLICFIALCEAPEIRTEFLISEDKEDPGHFPRLVEFGSLINVAGFNANKDSLSAERLTSFQAAKKTVAVWTINESAEFHHFATLGVDAIITNFPAECRATLRDKK